MHKKLAKHRVGLVAIPGTPIFEVALAWEVFGIDRRDLTPDWYELVVHPTTPDAVLAGGFVAAQPTPLRGLRHADTVLVPGCAGIHDAAPPALLEELRRAHERGARIAAICSGAFVLAQGGLLDGRTATTHWMHADELARRHPQVSVDASVLYLQQDTIWTSAGTAAGIDMCLEIVRTDHGAAVAAEVARRMVMPPHRTGTQAQFVRRPLPPRGTTPEQQLLDWARAHLNDDLTVRSLADRSGLSHRTLIRKFKATTGLTPQDWISRERVTLAQQLLETTALPVDRVAQHCGLGSAANLRIQFQRHVSLSPSQYRRTFTDLTETTTPANP